MRPKISSTRVGNDIFVIIFFTRVRGVQMLL